MNSNRTTGNVNGKMNTFDFSNLPSDTTNSPGGRTHDDSFPRFGLTQLEEAKVSCEAESKTVSASTL